MNRKTSGNRMPFICAAAVLAVIAVTLIIVFAGKGNNNSIDDTKKENKTESTEKKEENSGNHVFQDEIKGVYVPSAFNLAFPSRTDLTKEDLILELDAIVSKTKEAGLNSIFFQVRPNCDALYKSDYFPVSESLSSNGELTLDCLEYLINKAHSEGISVTAWINPLRITSVNAEISDLPQNSPAAGEYSDYVISYAGKLYFDPGSPEVRELICKGVSEIVTNYDVDGILFDDYFYPYKQNEVDENGVSSVIAFNDDESFETFGASYNSLEDWRRDNINKLIKSVFDTVKSADDKCLFGTAVFGIWQNDNGINGGSATAGMESYSELYCDTAAWIDGGYIDYVAPQIYWDMNNTVANYKILSEWWNEKCKGSGVDLLISHAAYRYEEAENAFSQGEMTNQLSFAADLSEYSGSIFYSYAAFRDDLKGITSETSTYYAKESASSGGATEKEAAD